MLAANGCSSLDVAKRHGQIIWLIGMLVQIIVGGLSSRSPLFDSAHPKGNDPIKPQSSCRSFGWQRVAKAFIIPEKSCAGKGQNSTFLLLAILLLHSLELSISQE